jgi:hypothetical protein
MQEAKAYAASIYLMAGMPYALLGSFGLAFYVSVKKAQRKARQVPNTPPETAPPATPGSCPV